MRLMSDALSIAASGVRAASARFEAAATAVVRAQSSDTPSDSAAPIVDMIQARTGFAANLAVMRVADRTYKSLLDIIA